MSEKEKVAHFNPDTFSWPDEYPYLISPKMNNEEKESLSNEIKKEIKHKIMCKLEDVLSITLSNNCIDIIVDDINETHIIHGNKIIVKSKWIKCCERMPDLYQWVLVTDSPKGTREPRCINIWRWDGRDWDSVEYLANSPTFSDIIYQMHTDEVTHWMPLPDMPEE